MASNSGAEGYCHGSVAVATGRALGPYRFLFGTDGPAVARLQEAADHREELRRMGLTPEELDEIFGLSSARILGINID